MARSKYDMPVTERDALAAQMRIRPVHVSYRPGVQHYEVYTYISGSLPLKWMWIRITQEEKLHYERTLRVKEITFAESLTYKREENQHA